MNEAGLASNSGLRSAQCRVALVLDPARCVAATAIAATVGSLISIPVTEPRIGDAQTPCVTVRMSAPAIWSAVFVVAGYDHTGEFSEEVSPEVIIAATARNHIWFSRPLVSVKYFGYIATAARPVGTTLELGAFPDIRRDDGAATYVGATNLGFATPRLMRNRTDLPENEWENLAVCDLTSRQTWLVPNGSRFLGRSAVGWAGTADKWTIDGFASITSHETGALPLWQPRSGDVAEVKARFFARLDGSEFYA